VFPPPNRIWWFPPSRIFLDDLEMLRFKMREYMDAGVLLEWLINPQQQQVEIYRQGQDVEVRNLPTKLSGENLLPGFSLSLSPYK
jgi:Uma2 family endonuclease